MTTRYEWYETFFDGLYARVLAGQSDRSRTLQEARTIKRVLRLRKGQQILDCPCGLGRITFELAGMGLNVTGTDLTASYIGRAHRLDPAHASRFRRGLT